MVEATDPENIPDITAMFIVETQTEPPSSS